jgi:hypothetical protein
MVNIPTLRVRFLSVLLEGHLIGLNFDRSWESTMSDIMFDPDLCRNIMVDIRYVLFIIDKYAGAEHLIREMDLISNTK